jgi:hypothetical protein
MNRGTMVWMGALGAMIFALALLVIAQPAAATNDPPAGGGTVTGDWTVTDARSFAAVTITVQDGNVYVASGGSLTMSGTRLLFYNTNPSASLYSFEVQAGGTLSATQSCNISTTGTNAHYNFIIRGAATIDRCTVSEMWGDINSWTAGIQIYSDSVTISNSSIMQGRTGGISIFDCSPTIYLNSVFNNGQDGGCGTYCYGIYAWNTKTNFSSNAIYSNQYKNMWYQSYSYSGSPGGYYYYGSQWVTYGGYSGNNEWYYNIGYCYRYLYTYDYQKANVYGTGVVIQGGSNATFHNNSVYNNGRLLPGAGYSYSNTYDGSGYAYSPYYYTWYGYYYSSFYTYRYSYQYYSWDNYGYGLVVDNSTVNIVSNSFDSNGWVAKHDYWADANSACFYTGSDIKMTNSDGDITNNTINNACNLIDLLNVRTNITGNKMTSDSIGGAVSYYSANFVRANAAFAVKSNNSNIPNILNNTILIQYKDYPYYYINGTYRTFAQYVTAVQLGTVAYPIRMEGNKITIDSQYYGSVGVNGIIMDLRTDLNFLSNQIEYKRTNNYGGPTAVPPAILMTAGNRNNVLIDGCTIKGPITARTGLPPVANPTLTGNGIVYGVLTNYGTTLTVVNSTLGGCDFTLQGLYAVNMKVTASTFSGCGWAIQGLYASKIYIRDLTISSAFIGVQGAYASAIDMANITMKTCDNGVHASDFTTAVINNCSIAGTKASSVVAEGRSTVTIDNVPMNGNGLGLRALMSTVTIRDCTMSHGMEFYLDQGALVEVMNTPHTKGSVQIMDMASYLNVSWRISIVVVWQNELPVAGASLRFATLAGAEVFSVVTNESGTTPEKLWIKEYMAHLGTVIKYTPHRITATKGRATSTDLFFIDKSVELVFRLVDTVPPALFVKSPMDGQNLNMSMVKIEGTASDPESGLTEGGSIFINIDNRGWVTVPVDQYDMWSYTQPMGDGLHVVRLRADDVAGNVARDTLSFTVDTQGPVLYVFNPKEGSSTNQRTILVSGITEETAIVTVNGISAPLTKRSFSLRLSLEDGPNTINVVASDPSGNTRMLNVHVTLDTQPPLLEVSSPLNGAYTNQDPVSVLGLTEPTAVVKVNGVLAPLSENRFETLVGLSEGVNTITVTSTDLAGNEARKVVTLHLDSSAPALTVFTPRDALWTNQSRVLVTGATEDGATVSINGQVTNVVATLFSGYVNLLEGPNLMTIVAKDQAMNTLALTRIVYLDTRAPDLLLTTPADRSNLASRVVPVLGSVDWGAEVTVNGEPVDVKDFLFSTTVLFPQDGKQTLEVVARDRAGNSAVLTRTLNIDTSVPVLAISYPVDGMSTKQRMVTVIGQTEPYATVVVNTETVVVVGRDGLFSVAVMLEDGENRITVTAMDASGNRATASVTATKPVVKAAAKEDLTWALNLTGLLMGMGITLPVVTYVLTQARRRRQAGVLAEVEAAEAARRERAADEARLASLPKVERVGKKREKPVEAPREEKAPEVLPEAPKAEAAAPEAAKTGLRDKSGATEVSPDEIDQETRMKAQSSAEEPKAKGAEAESSLKDKGGEAEGEAGETEGSGITRKK